MYGAPDKVPTDLNKITADFADIAKSRFSDDTLLGTDQATKNVAINRKAEELKAKDSSYTTTKANPFAPTGRIPSTKPTSAYVEEARKKLFADDRILKLDTLMKGLTKKSQRIVNTAPFLADYDTFQDVLSTLPPDEVPQVVAAIQMSNPESSFLPKYLMAAAAESGGGMFRFGENIAYKASQEGRHFKGHNILRTRRVSP
jgi:hypothetical protein